jgi:hypothetical protein
MSSTNSAVVGERGVHRAKVSQSSARVLKVHQLKLKATAMSVGAGVGVRTSPSMSRTRARCFALSAATWWLAAPFQHLGVDVHGDGLAGSPMAAHPLAGGRGRAAEILAQGHGLATEQFLEGRSRNSTSWRTLCTEAS